MSDLDLRPNGRAARVQRAVHDAVRALQGGQDRGELTVPKIAALAGVAPSTIYRRWGDLNQLLADVAVARLRPDPPPDRGSARADLQAWAEQYIEEAASATGREFLRDMVSGGPDRSSAHRGGAYARQRVEVMLERARRRGEQVPDLEDVIDLLLAPIVYRILFEPAELEITYAGDLTERLFSNRGRMSRRGDSSRTGETPQSPAARVQRCPQGALRTAAEGPGPDR